MSRKEREKKLAKTSEIEMEKRAAEVRRRQRTEPVTRLIKKFGFTLMLTVIIIAVAFIINGHLDVIAANLVKK